MTDDSTRPLWPFKHITKMAAHSRGQWCKKLHGKLRYWGHWRNPDPDNTWAKAALNRYLAEVQAEVTARELQKAPGDITVSLVANHWLTDREQAMKAGRLTPRQFLAYKALARKAAQVLGETTRVAELAPSDMKRLRDSLTGGPVWVGSQVRWLRGMFNWGMEYYGVRPRYGGQFSSPQKLEMRRARKAFDPFTPAELKRVLKVATPAVRCFILLGLNCGFGQTDCARLPAAVVDLKGRMLRYERWKTGVARACPLWPETVKALQAYVRPEGHPELFFVTRFGRPYVSYKLHEEAGEVVKAVRVDSIRHEFAMAQRMALGKQSRYQVDQEKYRKTRGFYVLRHMFRDIAEETGKANAIRVIMGHAFPGMDEYYLHLKSSRYAQLRQVTGHVRRWLFS